MTRSSRAPRVALSISSLALVGVIVAACAAGGGSDVSPQSLVVGPRSNGASDAPAAGAHGADQSRTSAERNAVTGDGAALEPAYANDSLTDFGAASLDVASVAGGPAASAPPQPDSLSPLVISTGAVALQSDDVDQARFDVQKVVDHYGGQITEEETHTNDEGDIKTSRMVLRIPSKD
ncbi:MAG: hypothetical protein JWO11_1200, partial [Nocardioides sp.]|nr:hypothetical protein [Nocardioides sp.]